MQSEKSLLKTLVGLIIVVGVILVIVIYNQNKDVEVPIVIPRKLADVKLKCLNPFIENASNPLYRIDGWTYPMKKPSFFDNTLNFTCLNENKHSKVILFWNKPYSQGEIENGIKKGSLKDYYNCPVTNCEVTNYRLRFNDSDMIVFGIYEGIDSDVPPRLPHQRFILQHGEHQLLNRYDQYDGFFNLTASFHQNSNFYNYFGYYFKGMWLENKTFDANHDYLKGKTGFAVQVASNCVSVSAREYVINELKNYIEIDVYGKCGQPCPVDKDQWMGFNCRDALTKKYKFFFAFENTLCDYYITEKFFTTLNYDIIPVVYGAGDYENYVPKSGYINIKDFKSPKEIADYLIKVASNATLYNSYFQWKRYITFSDRLPWSEVCEMCLMLNLEDYYGIKYNTIEKWSEFFNPKKDCHYVDPVTYEIKPWSNELFKKNMNPK